MFSMLASALTVVVFLDVSKVMLSSCASETCTVPFLLAVEHVPSSH